MGADGWFATGKIRFARSKQESARSKCKAEGPRSRRRFGRAHPLHVEHLAQIGTANQEPRRPSARSLSAWDFRRRFSGGPRRPARQGRAQPVRSCVRASSSHWRCRARVLEGSRRGVPDYASSALLAGPVHDPPQCAVEKRPPYSGWSSPLVFATDCVAIDDDGLQLAVVTSERFCPMIVRCPPRSRRYFVVCEEGPAT